MIDPYSHRLLAILVVTAINAGCAEPPVPPHDGAIDAVADVPRVDTGPACTLDCTGFDPSGACYCQTTCGGGPVQLFTCHSDGCVCQGSHANSARVNIACTSHEAADQIYQACFRW